MINKTQTAVLVAVAAIVIIVIGLYGITMSNMLEVSANAHNATKERLEICQRNLATFKNLEEKNILDIESYILINYKRVPTIVAKEIAKKTVSLASKHGIAIPILVGMMEVESNFGPHGVSKKHARGLMQVRWKIWGERLKEELGLTDHHQLHQIEAGIEAGIIVFKHYMAENNYNVSKALYAYVGQSRDYVTKVYSAMGKFVLHGVSTIPPVEDCNEG